MTCECYNDEHDNWFECPECEHDRLLEIEEAKREEKKIKE